MKLQNNIGWCDVTANPGIGCRGCELGDQCYAKFDTPARVLRAGKWPGYGGKPTETFGPGRTFVPTKKGLTNLRAWNKLCICDKCRETWPVEALTEDYRCLEQGVCYQCGGPLRRIRAFCDSNSDWMDWPTDVLAAALDEIRLAPNVDVILLTKWPELFDKQIFGAMLVAEKADPNDEQPYRPGTFCRWLEDWWNGNPPANVITPTSVLGNANDQKRIEGILAMPSACRGLSCEPLWSEPDIEPALPWKAEHRSTGLVEPLKSALKNLPDEPGVDWIIVGCDSSTKHKGWDSYEANARRIIEQCREAGVAVYHKQMPINGRVSLNPAEWPEWARVRENPENYEVRMMNAEVPKSRPLQHS